MKTCNDCIHCEACISQVPRTFWDSETFYDGCKYFKDKSGFIEIPCKVGDTVYIPWHWNNKNGIAFAEVEEIKIYDSNNHYMFLIDLQSDDEEFNQSFGGWKIGKSIGETAFLTREEAEQALKERE